MKLNKECKLRKCYDCRCTILSGCNLDKYSDYSDRYKFYEVVISCVQKDPLFCYDIFSKGRLEKEIFITLKGFTFK